MYAAETKVVPARGKAMIGTGIAVAVPIGTCMFASSPHAPPAPHAPHARPAPHATHAPPAPHVSHVFILPP